MSNHDRMDRVAKMPARFEVPVIVAALLVIPSMALVRADSGSGAWWAGVILNTVIWLVFLAEVADPRRRASPVAVDVGKTKVSTTLRHPTRTTRQGRASLPGLGGSLGSGSIVGWRPRTTPRFTSYGPATGSGESSTSATTAAAASADSAASRSADSRQARFRAARSCGPQRLR